MWGNPHDGRMEDANFVVDLVGLAEAVWIIGGAVLGVLGTLIFGRNYKQRISALEKSANQPPVQINLAPGATYQEIKGGTHTHITIEGGAEIKSPFPVRIAGRLGIGSISMRKPDRPEDGDD